MHIFFTFEVSRIKYTSFVTWSRYQKMVLDTSNCESLLYYVQLDFDI